MLYDTVMSSYACSTYDSNMRVGILVELQYFGALRWNLRRRNSDAPRKRDSPDGDAEARESDGEGRRPVYFGRYRGIHQQQGTTFSDAELTAFIRHVRAG